MTLDRYFLKLLMPVFISALLFFVLLLALIDLFANLWRYLSYEVPFSQILTVSLYYLPQCVSYALPVSLLFAVAYVLGELYAKNEFTVICSSGIPLWRFVLPLFIFSLGVSIASFFFEDRVVIPTVRQKNSLSRLLLRQTSSMNNSDVVVKKEGGRIIYIADFYNESDKSLQGLLILIRNNEGQVERIVRIRRAQWQEQRWSIEGATEYVWEQGTYRGLAIPEHVDIQEEPETFRRSSLNIEELSVHDARLVIKELEKTGHSVRRFRTDYYRRYAFSVTTFIVSLLAISLGGLFKKNILLMSLLSSLIAAVIYYVSQMLFMLLAKTGYISPLYGAWFPVFIFVLIGMVGIVHAKT
ncbi:MAG: LptF/LptG family permease [Treponemataceae bacterium]|nr:LptF/LptG family permease [Treponemataceae bacterium]